MSTKAIGGYFELELDIKNCYYPDLLALNTGRNAFEFVLRHSRYKRVYIPYYTCDVILEPLLKLNIECSFYRINNQFEIDEDLSLADDTALLYTNYYGLKDSYVNHLSRQYRNLIIDNSQSFFSPPGSSIPTFYSPRKFFGVPDGAYLSFNFNSSLELEKDESFERCSHLLKRIDLGAEAGFMDYQSNDAALSNSPVRIMSDLTAKLLSQVNYEKVRQARRENYHFLHQHLKEINELNLNLAENAVPMIYPLLTANRDLKTALIKNKIYVATYWPNVLEWTSPGELEHTLASSLVCLPIDQRYSIGDMEHVLNVINKNV